MIIRPSAFSLSLTLAFTLPLIDGCTSAPAQAHFAATHDSRHQREIRMKGMWKGKPYAALLQAYGPPRLVMSVANHHPLFESVAVYGVVDQATDCIDAFLLAMPEPDGERVISDYFCR